MLQTVKPNQNARQFIDRLHSSDGEMEATLFSVQSKSEDLSSIFNLFPVK
jgi:hypothetical protein